MFENYNFNTEKRKCVADYLQLQSDILETITDGVLTMNLDILGDGVGGPKFKPYNYRFSITCPMIGNYTKTYLNIYEKSELYFPVDINICETGEMIRDVSEEDFLKTIEEILSRPSIKRSIEFLYEKSLDF